MKKIIILFLLCTTFSYSQKKPKIKGDKNVIQTTFDLIDFNALEVNDDIEITFSTQNYKNTYTLNADANLYETIKFEVVDSILKISTASKISTKKKLEIVLNAKKLNSIKLNNNAKLKQVGILETEHFTFEAKDNAKAKLDVKAKTIISTMSNNATGDFFFQADSIRLILNDEIDIKGFIKTNYFDLDMYKDAEATLDGYSEKSTMALVGKPTLKSEKMIHRKVKLRASNNSIIEINCSEEIKLFLEDKSKLYLYNSPNIIIDGLRNNTEIIKR